MKQIYSLYAAWRTLKEKSLSIMGDSQRWGSDIEIPFWISIVDGIIRRFEEISIGVGLFDLKNYYSEDDIVSWLKTLEVCGGACDDRSFIYEMEFSYGATYIYNLLDHVIENTPLSKAWKMSTASLCIYGEDMIIEDDAESSISDIAGSFGCSFTAEQKRRLRTILEEGGLGFDDAIDYAKKVCDRATLFDIFIPLSEDWLAEKSSPEYDKICKALVDSIYADFYCEDLGDEILGIRNALLPQYHRWRERGNPLVREEDRVACFLLEDALRSLKFSSAGTGKHYKGEGADFWYSIYSPNQYSPYSLQATPIHEVLAVYVIDICLMQLDEHYHFVEGGVEKWAA